MADKIIKFIVEKQNKTDLALSLPTISISKNLVQKIEARLASVENHEQVVYLAGTRSADKIEVREIIAPKAGTSPTSFRVTSFTNAEIITSLLAKGLEIIAQVSTRPIGAGTSIALTDNEMGFPAYENMFFILVKDYGLDGILPLAEKAGIYVYRNNAYICLTKDQIKSFFKIE